MEPTEEDIEYYFSILPTLNVVAFDHEADAERLVEYASDRGVHTHTEVKYESIWFVYYKGENR